MAKKQTKVAIEDVLVIGEDDLKDKIHLIRGQKVMLDADLAEIYGYETKAFNRQVKNNIEKFEGEDFMFRLSRSELSICSRCKNCTSRNVALFSGNKGGTRYLPYAFTEQGIAQLSSVVHSQEAIERSIVIMNAFVAMRRFIVQNAGVLMRIAHLERHQIETDEKIDLILDKMAEQSPNMLPEQIFQTGCVWDAWSYVSDLVRSAKNRIVLIDNFVDDRVLSLLDKRTKGVSATIHSRYNEQFQVDLNKHNEQYPMIDFVQLPHRNHDRFLIIDNKAFIMGASLKDMGAGLCAVTEMQASPETILGLLG